MPTIEKFTLKNFKGIEEVSIDMDDRAKSPVITLIQNSKFREGHRKSSWDGI